MNVPASVHSRHANVTMTVGRHAERLRWPFSRKYEGMHAGKGLDAAPVRWHLGVMSTPTSLVDPFGRAVSYLRISVTDRCDLRCVYCMSEDMTFLPKNELLSFEEIERIAGAFLGMGTRKIRLTGGEPLVRQGNYGAHPDAG